MPAASVTSAPPSEQSLEEALRPVHNAWIAEARRFLEPTLEPGADFWTRWAAVGIWTTIFASGIGGSARW